LVAHRELAGHHPAIGEQVHRGTGDLVEDGGHDAAVRDAGGAVESVGDRIARQDAFASPAKAQLQSRRVRGRAAEAAAVRGEAELHVFGHRHGAEAYAPGPREEATPAKPRAPSRIPPRAPSAPWAPATRSRPGAVSG